MSQQLELLTEVPSQWSSISNITPDIQRKEIKPFVVLALKELEGNPDSRTSSLMSVDKFAAVREVVRHVVRARSATREPWELGDMKMFLENLRFSPDCVAELSTLLCAEQLYTNIPAHLRVKPGLAGLQWKIDMSLSQANMEDADQKQILRRDTFIILILKLTDGQTRTYRLSIAKFHELRFVVASALKSVIVLEKRKCMRKD
ncbi:COMM domain-containing protein 5-like [Leguminivora glycinivorella]|uniref:COMM domain-containing protein 5-like n=1 Tax=Leguminivora glycinivorella TaxID=1035111 RepID=UPI00200D4C05|nr:COMM domain-containing protein 5-like [Leguminivora glycinivorella]